MFGWFKRNKVKREIVINAENLETRVAILENGRLEEYQVEHPTQERIVGSIYKGRIQNLENDLQAAFVDIGLNKNAFLHYWDMFPDDSIEDFEEGGRRNGRSKTSKRKRFSNDEVARRYPPGSEIIVQVTKGPIGTKGPRVSADLSIPGRFLVMMPGVRLKGVSRKIDSDEERKRLKKVLDRLPIPEGMGIIARTVASGASTRSVARDLRSLAGIWTDLRKCMANNPAPCCLYEEPDLVERVVRDWLTEDIDRITIDSRNQYDRIRDISAKISRSARSKVSLYDGVLPVFQQFGVEKQLAEAFHRKVELKSGGHLVFDETEALIAIDVNTARHKGKGSQEETILQVNLEAVDEVARQLRLRNVGGLVVIDLIDMKSRKHQNIIYKAMKNALKRDRARTNVLAISELGIMEMTRQRVEESVLSSLMVDCPYCKGRGSVKSPLGVSVEIQRQLAAIMRINSKKDGVKNLQVVVHPSILERLKREDEAFLVDLQSGFDGTLGFRSDPSRHVEQFMVVNAENGDILYPSGLDKNAAPGGTAK